MTIEQFIIDRLKNRFPDLKHSKTKTDKHLDFILCEFTSENKIHSLKFLSTEPGNIQKWYEITHFDKSMDANDKIRTLKEYPVQAALEEFYPQVFTIDNKEYRVQFKTSTD